ncbi:hypothetical protein [Paenibacillus amylolyticus]|nr:hypothetical protein [Paenibacillus amylolyticus]
MSNYMFPKETNFVSIYLLRMKSISGAEKPLGIPRNQKWTF